VHTSFCGEITEAQGLGVAKKTLYLLTQRNRLAVASGPPYEEGKTASPERASLRPENKHFMPLFSEGSGDKREKRIL